MGLYKLPKRFHPDFAYPGVKPRSEVKLDRENKYGARMLFYGIVVEGGLYDVVGGDFYKLPNATFEEQHGDLVARYSGTFSDTLTLVTPVPWQEDAGLLGERTVGLRGSRLTQGTSGAIGKMANVHTDQGAVDERVEFDTQQNFGADVSLYNSHQKGKFSWNQWDNVGLGNDHRPLERLTNMATSTYSYLQTTTPYEHGAISYVNGVYVGANEGSHGPMPHTGFTTIIMGNTDSGAAHVCVSNVWIAEGVWSAEDQADFDLDVWQALAPVNAEFYTIPAAADGGVSGTIAVTLDAFPAAGAGTSTDPVTGTTAVTLGVFQAAAAGSSIDFVTGNVAVTLDVFPASGAGTSTDNISGTVAVTLAEFNPTASGVVGDGVNGSIAATLGEFTPASAGLIAMTGDMVTTLDAFTSIANATVTDSPNGSVAAVLDLFVCAATGTGGTITETHYDGGDYYGRLYNKQFGETIQDAEKRYLIANGATPAANLADMWVELLVAAGYTGDLETMWRAWQANGATW